MLNDLISVPRKSRGERVWAILSVFIGSLVLLTALVFIIFSVSFSRVSGDSMLSTIRDGEYILCVRPSSLRRGDIVTADTGAREIVKRVVGVPGDRIVFVSMGDGLRPYTSDEKVCLYVDSGDGFRLAEESEFIFGGYMTEFGFNSEKMFDDGEYMLYAGDIGEVDDSYVITVDKGEYFLMGDHRDDSSDSRNYGKFPKAAIKGKAIQIIRNGSFAHGIMDFIYSPFSCR